MRVLGPQVDASFPTTNWSLVTQGAAALGPLFERYRPAIHAYLVRRKLVSPGDVDDLLQGFVLNQMVEKDLLARADPQRGRFRSLLLTALHRYLVTEWRRRQRAKRSPDGAVRSLNEVDEAAIAPRNGVDVFDEAWARCLLEQALRQMKETCRTAGRDDVWSVFELKLLGPILGRAESISYKRMCEQWGLTSPGQASNLLVTAKRTFARTLRSLIAEYTASEVEVDEEIRELARVLGGSSA